MDPRPIGVFDSGVGGLTVLKALEAALPGESFLYLGDTARVPYGSKSPETVTRYGVEAARFFRRQGVKLLVVACNTVSAVAMEAVAEEAGVPAVGVIVPGARRAARLSREGRIGVIGTRATVESQAYSRAILAARPEATVIAQPCPLFVPLAEEGWTEGEVAEAIARAYLAPLAQARVDAVVLGCTHYPLLKGVIGRVMGGRVALVDSAESVAEEVRDRLARDPALAAPAGEARSPQPVGGGQAVVGRGLAAPPGEARSSQFFVTDAPAPFLAVAERFLGRSVSPVWRARLEGEER